MCGKVNPKNNSPEQIWAIPMLKLNFLTVHLGNTCPPMKILAVSATLWIQYRCFECLKKWTEKGLNEDLLLFRVYLPLSCPKETFHLEKNNRVVNIILQCIKSFGYRKCDSNLPKGWVEDHIVWVTCIVS